MPLSTFSLIDAFDAFWRFFSADTTPDRSSSTASCPTRWAQPYFRRKSSVPVPDGPEPEIGTSLKLGPAQVPEIAESFQNRADPETVKKISESIKNFKDFSKTFLSHSLVSNPALAKLMGPCLKLSLILKGRDHNWFDLLSMQALSVCEHEYLFFYRNLVFNVGSSNRLIQWRDTRA